MLECTEHNLKHFKWGNRVNRHSLFTFPIGRVFFFFFKYGYANLEKKYIYFCVRYIWRIFKLHEKDGFVTATKLRTTDKIFVAATKNFAAATKRFVDRTKDFVTRCSRYLYFNK